MLVMTCDHYEHHYENHIISYLIHLSLSLSVNYRGSTGFGQDGVECLLGRIGRRDVDDVQVLCLPPPPSPSLPHSLPLFSPYLSIFRYI